jgi:hypothetical protein
VTGEHIARALHGRRSGRGWMTRCPAHQDRGPSLRIDERDGRLLVHCHAGCVQADVIAALRARGLWQAPERTWTPAERRKWIRERQELERLLPEAQLWRDAAVVWIEEELVDLKAALFDPTLPPPEIDFIQRLEVLLQSLRSASDGALVDRYRSWATNHPWLSCAMVHVARKRKQAARNVLIQILNQQTAEAAG